VTIYRGAGSGDAVYPLRRAAAQDDRLSYRARGILAAVMSRPKNWRVGGIEQLAQEGREGEAAVAAALLELEHFGYLRRVRIRIGRGDPSGRRAGSVVTAWDMTDDPSLLVSTGTQLPRAGQPRAGQPRGGSPRGGSPRGGSPRGGKPRDLEIEREGRETPPPPPADDGPDPAEVDELVGVVVRELQGRAPLPAARTLRARCAELAAAAWTPDQVARLVREHDWSGARAGAVVALLRDPGTPPAPGRGGAASRPAWCGACDESTRLLESPETGVQRCPTCHPLSARGSA
jgi:hypothetical protein